MNIRPRFKTTMAALLGASIALQPMVSLAALHQMSYLKTDSPTLQTIDMTVNTDFDFDASPSVVVGSTSLDRAYITAALQVTAQSMFTMTEGRHRLGSVFVYRNNRFGNNVDTKFITLTKGRSNAPTSAWGKREGTANNFLVSAENDVESAVTLGQVIAHENGHYVYGLYDEYREEGKAFDPNDLGGASQIDTPLDTMMHNHRVYTGLSTPADNAPAAINTAQKRAMGASAWETLARDPNLDPLPGKKRRASRVCGLRRVCAAQRGRAYQAGVRMGRRVQSGVCTDSFERRLLRHRTPGHRRPARGYQKRCDRFAAALNAWCQHGHQHQHLSRHGDRANQNTRH